MSKCLISSTLLLLVCTSLPLAKISAIGQVNKNQQSPPHAIIHQEQVSYTRSVAKFKSTRQPSQLDWFNKLKQAIADSNIAATTSNTSKFNMNIKYYGFNSFGIKVKHVVKSVGGNLKQPNLNIGLSLLSQVQVQVPGHSSTWDKYIEDSDDTLNYSKVRESSVTYKIVATGSKNDEAVAFVMSYAPRNAKATDKKVDLQLGHFDVYNENTNDKRYWESTGGGIAAGVLLVVVLAVIGTVLALNRASIRRYFTAKWAGDTIPNIPNISTRESVLGKIGTTTDDTLNDKLSENVLRTQTEQEKIDGIERQQQAEQTRLRESRDEQERVKQAKKDRETADSDKLAAIRLRDKQFADAAADQILARENAFANKIKVSESDGQNSLSNHDSPGTIQYVDEEVPDRVAQNQDKPNPSSDVVRSSTNANTATGSEINTVESDEVTKTSLLEADGSSDDVMVKVSVLQKDDILAQMNDLHDSVLTNYAEGDAQLRPSLEEVLDRIAHMESRYIYQAETNTIVKKYLEQVNLVNYKKLLLSVVQKDLWFTHVKTFVGL